MVTTTERVAITRAITVCSVVALASTVVGLVPWVVTLIETRRQGLRAMLVYQAGLCAWAIVLSLLAARRRTHSRVGSVVSGVAVLALLLLRVAYRGDLRALLQSGSAIGSIMLGIVWLAIAVAVVVVIAVVGVGLGVLAVTMQTWVTREGRSLPTAIAVLSVIVAAALLVCARSGTLLTPIVLAIALAAIAVAARAWPFVAAGVLFAVLGGVRQRGAFRDESARLARVGQPSCDDLGFSRRALAVSGVKTVRQLTLYQDMRDGALDVYVMPDGTRATADVVRDVAHELSGARCQFGGFDGEDAPARVQASTPHPIALRVEVELDTPDAGGGDIDRTAIRTHLEEQLAAMFREGPERESANVDGRFLLPVPRLGEGDPVRSVELVYDDASSCDPTYVCSVGRGTYPIEGTIDIVFVTH
jgi:hypothetical protein